MCETNNCVPRKRTQFFKYIQDLEKWGLIKTEKLSKGIKGRTTVIHFVNIPRDVLASEIAPIIRTKLSTSVR